MKRSIMMLSVSILILGLSSVVLPANADVPDSVTIRAAKTPADHEAIAKAYEAQAVSMEKMGAMHENLGETYAQPGGKPWQAAQAKHCKGVATDLAAAAKEERALAAEHHKMAAEAGK